MNDTEFSVFELVIKSSTGNDHRILFGPDDLPAVEETLMHLEWQGLITIDERIEAADDAALTIYCHELVSREGVKARFSG